MKKFLISLMMLLAVAVAFSPPLVEAQGNVPTIDMDYESLVQFAENFEYQSNTNQIQADVINLLQHEAFISDATFKSAIYSPNTNALLDRHRCNTLVTPNYSIQLINTRYTPPPINYGYNRAGYWPLL